MIHISKDAIFVACGDIKNDTLGGPRDFIGGRCGRFCTSLGNVVSLRKFEETKPAGDGYNVTHLVPIILYRFPSTNRRHFGEFSFVYYSI